MVKELIGNKYGKKYKGIIINQIQELLVKWIAIIVSIFLTLSGKPFYVKKEMLESIKNISYEGKKYNWANNVDELLKSNYERCQEVK